MLQIKWKLVGCIYQNEIGPNIGRDNSAADNRVIFFTAAVKLPCGLKQFEEFARCSPILRIRRNGNHINSAIAGLGSLSGWSALVRNITGSVWAPSQSRSGSCLIEPMDSNSIAEARLKEVHLRHLRTATFRASRYGRDT